MNQQNLDRLDTFLKERRLSAALLSDPHTLTWLTGYAPPIETGPSPFEGGPGLAWYTEAQLVLILSDAEAAAGKATGAAVQDYLSYTIDAPVAGLRNQADVLSKALDGSKTLKGRVGVERNPMAAPLLEAVQKALPSARLEPLDGLLDPLRAVKTSWEVEAIRAALALCDLAQAETRKWIAPGKTEIEVWTLVKARLEIQAGGRLPVLADFVAGARTGEIGGMPGTNIMHAGDAVIADIVPRLNGYWGDNAGTHFVDEAPPKLRKMYEAVLDALRKGVQAVKPGLKASDLDGMLRAQIRDRGYPVYPHHSGHGIGASYHEEPRIVPYNQMKLEPGMVIALEPGIYIPGTGGVRLEDVVLVTASGCEVLTQHLVNTG